MTKDPSRRQYWKDWQAQSLRGGEFIDTHAFISKDAYARIVTLASERRERVPTFTGKLATLALEIFEGGSAVDSLEKMKQPAEVIKLSADNLDMAATTIADAILASRFPDDTMSARLRQMALIDIISKETARGNTITANVIATITDGEAGQIRLLARLLTKRGILTMEGSAGVGSGTYAKILAIRPDALERFSKVHFEATGLPLVLNS